MVTMIALAVLTVLVVAAVRFTGANHVAAVGKVRGDRLAACVETGRRYLLSKLRVYGGGSVEAIKIDPNGVNSWAKLPDEPGSTQQSLVGPGHYGDDLTLTAPTIVLVPSNTMGAASAQIRDLSNGAPASGVLGGQYYRVVMKCQEPGVLGVARESEIEFTIRFGI